ncbi:uncharacterized protein LOC141620056 [Silene latifolia]|uniref:uncharacterized protein LOC141620056 n=1 Tax=Silene latifolia TaxID=37657 RepID=UPI003D7717AE
MECVSTVTFSVLINEEPSEELRLTRGLRQGDSLSPYLFILCAEALSNLMRRAMECNSLHGVRVSSSTAPAVSHLLFADDSIFFSRATMGEADVINDVLRKYEATLGKLVGLQKTMVSFSRGVSRAYRESLAARLGVVEMEEHKCYLGLSMVVIRSKKIITDIIRDKLCKQLQGWRGKILFRAGKEVLIKAVVNSLHTYVINMFKIPANFCDELRSICMERGSCSKGKGVMAEDLGSGEAVFNWDLGAIDTMLRLWNPKGKVMGNVLDAREKDFRLSFRG